MRTHKHVIAMLTVCMTALAMAGGCGKQQQDSQIFLYDPVEEQTDITLSMLGYKADSLNLLAIEDTLHGFMEQKPEVNITYEGIKGSAYWDALTKRADSGTLDDIIMVDHDRVMDFSSRGLLADLSGLSGLDNYAELASSQFLNEDGSVWFLPTCISAYGLYVNYDLLEADGQTVPTDWEEFAAVCDYYVDKGCAPVIVNNYSSLRVLMAAKGMFDVYQSEDTAAEISAFNAGEKNLAGQLAPGVEMVCEMIKRGWINCSEGLATTQTDGDLKLFVQGDRPFMVTGAWASPRVADMEPGFTYGVHPFPVLEDGSVLVVDAATCVAVSAGSAHQAETMDFIAYVIQPDVIGNYCESQSSYSPMKDNRTLADNAVAPLTEYLSNGRSVIGSDYRLTLPMDTALVECATALLRGADAEEAKTVLMEQLRKNG